jgi:hypothetical protein
MGLAGRETGLLLVEKPIVMQKRAEEIVCLASLEIPT